MRIGLDLLTHSFELRRRQAFVGEDALHLLLGFRSQLLLFSGRLGVLKARAVFFVERDEVDVRVSKGVDALFGGHGLRRRVLARRTWLACWRWWGRGLTLLLLDQWRRPHELGSPLTLVDGHAQRALRDPNLPGTVRSELDSVRREVKRMTRLVRQLLDYGRPERHPAVSTDARRLVTVCLSSIGASPRREDDVRIETFGEGDDLRIMGEESKLEHALINILRNAVEAARSRVELRWRSTGQSVIFSVDDDGPGVDANVRDTLFEPFVTTKRAQGGTGLGLAIAHAAAVECGGQLELSRSLLGGARFELILPREGSDAGQPANFSAEEGRTRG